MDTDTSRDFMAAVDASLMDNPQSAVYAALHGNGDLDITLAGEAGTDRVEDTLNLLAMQIRYLSDALDVHEAAVAYDATNLAVENRDVGLSEEVSVE